MKRALILYVFCGMAGCGGSGSQVAAPATSPFIGRWTGVGFPASVSPLKILVNGAGDIVGSAGVRGTVDDSGNVSMLLYDRGQLHPFAGHWVGDKLTGRVLEDAVDLTMSR